MAAKATKSVSVHDRCGVAPLSAAGDVAEQVLPLTFLDMVWVYFHRVQRLLFYRYPCSSTDFLETIAPNLKKSLSQTLRHYLPLAGNLLFPLDPNSGPPELRYVAGDSVLVTFAVSSEAFDFNYMTGNQPREADEFYPLVPDLPEPRTESESGFEVIPVLAIQVTLFPETGISIGFTNHHVIGDASSIVGFIKAWSSMARLGELPENHPLPVYDRSLIKDPSGRANIFWNQIKLYQTGSAHIKFATNRVRATFVLQKPEIQILKNLASAREPGLTHLSSFVVTTAYVWACQAKASADAGEEVDDDEPWYFCFAVDARHRLEPPLPASYFGNCLAFVGTESKGGTLKGDDGFFVAVKLVADVIREKVNDKEELWRDADDWLLTLGPLLQKRHLGVAGSPKFDLYDADFGWGKPSKFESVSIDMDQSMSLSKSREFEGGLEIGLSLPRKKMDAFAAVFSNGSLMKNGRSW